MTARTPRIDGIRNLIEADRRCHARVADADNAITCYEWNIFTNPDNNEVYLTLWGDDKSKNSVAILMLDKRVMREMRDTYDLIRQANMRLTSIHRKIAAA